MKIANTGARTTSRWLPAALVVAGTLYLAFWVGLTVVVVNKAKAGAAVTTATSCER